MSLAYDLGYGDTGEGDRSPIRGPHRRGLALVPPPVANPRHDVARPAGSPVRRSGQQSGVTSLAVLRPLDEPAPVRLTRRGVLALGLLVAAVGLAVVAFGALSARSAATPASAVGPRVVTVRPGDTLWSIASGVAPGIDPRAEIATIDRLNGLHGVALVPGQRLRVR